jgi:hypothetical protein
MPVTLINKQKRKRTFHLDHPAFAAQSKAMTVIVVEEKREGGRYPKRVRKNVPGVLTLLSREKRHSLPDQILAVPAIKQAIAEGTLAFLKVKATAAAEDKSKRKKRK